MTDVLFPMVVCPRHGEVQKPGYIVCIHVIGDPSVVIGHMQTPTIDHLGEVLCVDCYTEYQSLDRLKLVCADCVHQLINEREFR